MCKLYNRLQVVGNIPAHEGTISDFCMCVYLVKLKAHCPTLATVNCSAKSQKLSTKQTRLEIHTELFLVFHCWTNVERYVTRDT